MSMIESIRDALQAKFEPVHLAVDDISGGCGQSFSVVVSSAVFEGVALLERHRLVQDCLSNLMPNIHALQMKTWTPAQLEKKRAAGAV